MTTQKKPHRFHKDIVAEIEKTPGFRDYVQACLEKFDYQDWGILNDPEKWAQLDQQAQALAHGAEGRTVGIYQEAPFKKIGIVEELEFKAIFFPSTAPKKPAPRIWRPGDPR